MIMLDCWMDRIIVGIVISKWGKPLWTGVRVDERVCPADGMEASKTIVNRRCGVRVFMESPHPTPRITYLGGVEGLSLQ